MKASEAPAALSVLDHVLSEVRREKSRRRRRRAVLIAAVPLAALAACACWLASGPAVQVSPVASGTSQIPPAPEKVAEEPRETLAILVLRDGYPCLEERDTRDLADLDLTFTLDPVLAQAR